MTAKATVKQWAPFALMGEQTVPIALILQWKRHNQSSETTLKSCLERVDDIIVEFLPRESLAVGLTSEVAAGGGDTIDRGC